MDQLSQLISNDSSVNNAIPMQTEFGGYSQPTHMYPHPQQHIQSQQPNYRGYPQPQSLQPPAQLRDQYAPPQLYQPLHAHHPQQQQQSQPLPIQRMPIPQIHPMQQQQQPQSQQQQQLQSSQQQPSAIQQPQQQPPPPPPNSHHHQQQQQPVSIPQSHPPNIMPPMQQLHSNQNHNPYHHHLNSQQQSQQQHQHQIEMRPYNRDNPQQPPAHISQQPIYQQPNQQIGLAPNQIIAAPITAGPQLGQSAQPSCKVRVRNIFYQLKDEDIYEYMSCAGTIVDYTIERDANRQERDHQRQERDQHRVTGIFTYSDRESARCAVELLDNHKICGSNRELKVNLTDENQFNNQGNPNDQAAPKSQQGNNTFDRTDIFQIIEHSLNLQEAILQLDDSAQQSLLGAFKLFADQNEDKLMEFFVQRPQICEALLEIQRRQSRHIPAQQPILPLPQQQQQQQQLPPILQQPPPQQQQQQPQQPQHVYQLPSTLNPMNPNPNIVNANVIKPNTNISSNNNNNNNYPSSLSNINFNDDLPPMKKIGDNNRMMGGHMQQQPPPQQVTQPPQQQSQPQSGPMAIPSSNIPQNSYLSQPLPPQSHYMHENAAMQPSQSQQPPQHQPYIPYNSGPSYQQRYDNRDRMMPQQYDQPMHLGGGDRDNRPMHMNERDRYGGNDRDRQMHSNERHMMPPAAHYPGGPVNPPISGIPPQQTHHRDYNPHFQQRYHKQGGGY